MNDEMYSSYDLLDILCPMHAVLNETGHVVHAGPTLHKVFADKPLIGARFLERVELRRPHVADTMEGLRGCHGARLHLRLRDSLRTGMKGVLIALSQDGPSLGPPGGRSSTCPLAFPWSMRCATSASMPGIFRRPT